MSDVDDNFAKVKDLAELLGTGSNKRKRSCTNTAVCTEHESVKGLYIVHDFIDRATERALLQYFDSQIWDNTLQRRVQHYGYVYKYKERKIDASMKAAPLPPCAVAVGQRISALCCSDGTFVFPRLPNTASSCSTAGASAVSSVSDVANADHSDDGRAEPSCQFDQLIVNEYRPGQGIAPHIDCKPCFTDGIASLSLNSGTVMHFRRAYCDNVDILLPRRSLIILTGEARYNWTHSIVPRLADNGVARQRRVSLTFRTVILAESEQDGSRKMNTLESRRF